MISPKVDEEKIRVLEIDVVWEADRGVWESAKYRSWMGLAEAAELRGACFPSGVGQEADRRDAPVQSRPRDRRIGTAFPALNGSTDAAPEAS